MGGARGVVLLLILNMAVDPTLLQMQLKRNNEDMKDMLQSLSSWEEEIKKRDELLQKQKPILKKVI